MKKVLVYLDEGRLAPHGGPDAVGYYYYTEMHKRNEDYFDFIPSKKSNDLSTAKNVAKHLPKWVYNFQSNLRDVIRINKLLHGKAPERRFDFSNYDIVHFHKTIDMYNERKQLESYKGIVVLQSHSPIPFGKETCANMPRIKKLFIPGLEKSYEKIDKYAFDRASYIIFPCQEAEEPYFNSWNYFAKIKEKKNNYFRYILTGINKPEVCIDRQTILSKHSIPDNGFIISYVGRHNYVKGYDLLKQIGKTVLESDNTWILAAGNESPMKRYNHPRWIEAGWTKDASSYIAASDVFVLPNRVTYFDIVMIEVLSLGKVVVASRTGGNKFYEKEKVPGVFLYDTIEEAVGLIDRIKSMDYNERKQLGQLNQEYYYKHLSTSAMYDSYIELLKEIGLDDSFND